MAAECGTHAAYQRHLRKGEQACEPCKAANRAYQAKYRAANPGKRHVETRKHAARQRAVWRLRLEYPTRYARLYSEELRKEGL